MPNRIIREGILTSDRVDQLDWPAEVFYRRLLSKVDDHGLYDARPSVLRAALYPLRIDRVREADISRWIAECVKAGLIVLYRAADDKQYMKVLDTRWQVRSDPKFPVPTTDQLIAIDNNCAQLDTKTESLSKSETYTPPTPQGEARPARKAFDEQFGRFWNVYPRKVAKGDAEKAWRKLNPPIETVEKMLKAIESAKASPDWQKDSGQFIPYPATWLNGKRWEDELLATNGTTKGVRPAGPNIPPAQDVLKRLGV
jgi:hypothetical protein